MRRPVVVIVLLGVAALPAIAIAIALGAYMLSTHSQQHVPEKQITLDFDQQDGMKDYIQEWIPASSVNKDKLLGTIEDEPATMIVRRNNAACSFEPALITVDIDLAKGGRVQRIFISSKGMMLGESVSSMKQILVMLDAKPDKLNKWARGAFAWSEDPKAWPKETATPMDAWYSEIVRTEDIECELEVRRFNDDAKPWRIVIRTGPRLFKTAQPKDEPPEQDQPPTNNK